jgi:hypothetical protein
MAVGKGVGGYVFNSQGKNVTAKKQTQYQTDIIQRSLPMPFTA